jgi:hypothetical protein
MLTRAALICVWLFALRSYAAVCRYCVAVRSGQRAAVGKGSVRLGASQTGAHGQLPFMHKGCFTAELADLLLVRLSLLTKQGSPNKGYKQVCVSG